MLAFTLLFTSFYEPRHALLGTISLAAFDFTSAFPSINEGYVSTLPVSVYHRSLAAVVQRDFVLRLMSFFTCTI
jgi:hypothetical protein